MSEYQSAGVDHPPHYNAHPTGVECIDIAEHFGFNIGNALKYLWRAGLKPGEGMIKDLEKAVWYLQREIKRLQNQPERRAKKDGVIENALRAYANSLSGYARSEEFVKSHLQVVPAKALKPTTCVVKAVIFDEMAEAETTNQSPMLAVEVTEEQPTKKHHADPSGTSDQGIATTADPIAEKSAVVVSNSKSPQKPCKDCGAPYDRSDWHRFKGICAACRKMQRDKLLAAKIAKLNEAEVKIGPDRNKPEPAKEALNKIISADYLLKRLKHDYPARGEFLVEDAMRITEMPFRDTLQLLQLIGEDRVKAISPAELKSQQKWKILKESK